MNVSVWIVWEIFFWVYKTPKFHNLLFTEYGFLFNLRNFRKNDAQIGKNIKTPIDERRGDNEPVRKYFLLEFLGYFNRAGDWVLSDHWLGVGVGLRLLDRHFDPLLPPPLPVVLHEGVQRAAHTGPGRGPRDGQGTDKWDLSGLGDLSNIRGHIMVMVMLW